MRKRWILALKRFIFSLAFLALLSTLSFGFFRLVFGHLTENDRVNADASGYVQAAPRESLKQEVPPEASVSIAIDFEETKQPEELQETVLQPEINLGEISEVQLEVSAIAQLPELPTGCEIVVTTMLLNEAGVDISKMEVCDLVPLSDDPSQGFSGGDPRTWNGYSVYPSALLPIMEQLGVEGVDMTGCGLDALRYQLASGVPVAVYVTDPALIYHCVLLTGFDEEGFTCNDPWTGEEEEMDYETFNYRWQQMNQRAFSFQI
jgi:uncharacterized protein YvpB